MNLMTDAALKVSALLVLALAATSCMRRQSAGARHWILTASIGCAVLLPAIALISPAWHLPMTSVRLPASASSVHAAFSSRGERLVIDSQPSSAPHVPSPEQPSTGRSTFRLLAGAWITGVALNIILVVAALTRLASIRSKARPLGHGRWSANLANLAAPIGIGRRIELLETDHPGLLITWGVLRPKVMIPAAARNWSDQRMRVVLAHELAHIRRADWAIEMMALLLRSLHWFNPLVWIACRRLRQESERACDDAVLNGGIERGEYVTHLVDLAHAFSAERRGLPGLPAPAVVAASNLERRVTAMLNERLNRNPLTRSARLLSAFAMLVITIPIAGLGAQQFATVSGTISDPVGGLIPNATLRLVHVSSQAKHEVRSDATGRFEFVGLLAGDYQLEALSMGFAPLRDRLTLAVGQTLHRNLTLNVGSLMETIFVGAGSRIAPPPPPPPPPPSPDGVAGGIDRRIAAAKEELEFRLAEAVAKRAATEAGIGTATASPPPPPPPLPSATGPEKPCVASEIGGRIKPPTKTRNVRPQLPESFRGENGVARVVLNATIGTDGTVKEISTVDSADRDLEEAATTAVRQWEFTPALLNCTPIEVSMMVNISFAR
jgi:TonB family protein